MTTPRSRRNFVRKLDGLASIGKIQKVAKGGRIVWAHIPKRQRRNSGALARQTGGSY